MKNVNEMDLDDWNVLYFYLGNELSNDGAVYQDDVMGNHVVMDKELNVINDDFHVMDIFKAPEKYRHGYEIALEKFNKRFGTDYSWYA